MDMFDLGQDLQFSAGFYDLNTMTEEVIHGFCEEQAMLDNECFLRGTAGDGKKFQNLWMVWDTDGNQKIDSKEFNAAFYAMDLDEAKEPKNLELSAYFYRNQDIVCRDIRPIV